MSDHLTKCDELFHRSMDLFANYHYVYGAKVSDGKLTKEHLDILAKYNPSVFTAEYKKSASAFIGQYCTDCSGLVCYLWDINNVGSSYLGNMHNYYPNEYEKIDVSKVTWGDMLYKKGHVAIALTNNTCIEAKSLKAGVLMSKKSSTKWLYAIRKKSLHKYGATGWIAEGTKWWYAYGESAGEYYKDTHVKIKGKVYWFDSDGYWIEN